jgi:hypothetical protein
MGPSETLIISQIYLLHSFLQIQGTSALLTSHRAHCAITLSQNYFPDPNRPYFESFHHPIFIVQDHVLNTVGEALTQRNGRTYPHVTDLIQVGR